MWEDVISAVGYYIAARLAEQALNMLNKASIAVKNDFRSASATCEMITDALADHSVTTPEKTL